MVHVRSNALSGNRLLSRLPSAEQRLLAAETEVVEVPAGEMLCGAGAPIRHVYFPRHGVVSLFASTGDAAATMVGVGMIRRDGMFGLGTAVGQTNSHLLAVTQSRGEGHRVEARVFVRVLAGCPQLQKALFAYAHAVATQMSQNAACAASHASRQRVARWMLDVTAGTRSAEFASTQADIAASLGVRRGAVSSVSGDLQRSGLIVYTRGTVTILDRSALRAVACRCSLASGRGERISETSYR